MRQTGERKEQRTYATTTQTPASVAEMLHRQKVTPPEVSWPDPRAHGRRNPVVSSLPLYPHLSGFGSIPRADNHSNTTYNLHHGGFQSTASPVLRSPDLDCNQAYNFGYESTYPQPMNAILPNTASSLDVAPEFISHYPEIPSEPQSYNSQTYPTSTTTNTDHFFNQPGSITDPMNATFPDTSYSPIVAP